MAVYTHLEAEQLARLIAHYDVGDLVSAKGIAEGVSNSNWLVETTQGRFVLTMYERRIRTEDLPFFLGLLDHLSAKGCPVPQTIHDSNGDAWRDLDGKAIALIEFLPGVSVGQPTPAQAGAVGKALAGIHLASSDFGASRSNDLRPADWNTLFKKCGTDGLSRISDTLPMAVATHIPRLLAQWPQDLPKATIHADLFPDNVLMLGDEVSGMIDFYFACDDFAAYDLAITHAAWSFSDNGADFRPDVGAALIAGYESLRQLSAAEKSAMPILGQGAAMRFTATRAYDWIHTPDDALVTRKDPMDFVRRLEFYVETGERAFSWNPSTGT